MSKEFDALDSTLTRWIEKQKMFFVATAPLDGDGLVNCSPKGGDSFRVLGEREVAYLDYTGSGIETVAHVRENGRIVIMFCAFEGPPKILRLQGRGRVLEPGDTQFARLLPKFPPNPGSRAIIVVHVERIADSCGYSVPHYEFKSARDGLDKWATKQGPQGLSEYWAQKNRSSLDGLPGLTASDSSED